MMRTHSSRIHPTDTMKRLACTSLAMAALFGLAQMQVFAQTGLEKVGTIDLSPYFGPDKAAAQLEGSKTFAKDVMSAAHVPTGGAVFTHSIDEVRALEPAVLNNPA